MNYLLTCLFAAFLMSGCGESTETKVSSDKKTTSVEAPSRNTSSKETVEVAETNYVNYINAKNSGSKKGKVTISGSIAGGGGNQKLFLYETEGKNFTKIDSCVMKDANFAFDKREFVSGFYKLGLVNDNNMVDFIINPDEAEIKLNFGAKRLSQRPSSVISIENEGWFEYLGEWNIINKQITTLKNQRKQSSMKERINADIAKKEKEILDLKARIGAKYPNTFLAKYMTWSNPQFANDKGKYWSDIDFSDESLVKSNVLPDRIQQYMRSFSGGTDAGFYNAIDVIKSHAEVNNAVLEMCLYTMLDGFYSTGKETVCLYILDNYILDGDCSADLSDVIKARAEGIINLQVGKTPPNFTILSNEGKRVNLKTECSKNEYTLVIFWASWCHKCEQEMPVLNQVYDKFNQKGFGVVGVSVDQAKGPWEKAIVDKKCERWPNVSQLKGWKAQVAKDYKVSATPTLFLLNKDMEIVAKPKRIYEVDSFLKSNLK